MPTETDIPSWIPILSFVGATLCLIGWASHRALGPTRGHFLQSDWVLAARFIYIFLHLVVFIGLTGVLVAGGRLGAGVESGVTDAVPYVARLKDILGGNSAPLAPIIALVAMYLGLKAGPISKADGEVLAWLHSTDHLEDEAAKLQAALETGPFEPSEAEVAKNRRKLQEHDVRIADNRFISGDIAMVTQWRKVACLLRFLTKWQAEPVKVLDRQEEAKLREIEKTDTRKTAHAFDIIRALRQASRRNASVDIEGMAAAEDEEPRWAQASGDAGGGAARVEYLPARIARRETLELTTDQLAESIDRIKNYFIDEYDLMLRRLCALAARAVIYSGRAAEIRLHELKTAGFSSLGQVRRLTIDNIMKMFVFTVAIVVATFLIWTTGLGNQGPNLFVMTKIGCVYAFAILCGAMIGANRKLAQRPHTPWAAFLLAGLMSFTLFVFVNFALAMVEAFVSAAGGLSVGVPMDIFANLSFGTIGPADGRQATHLSFADVLPWAVLPVIASIAICRIARAVWPARAGRLGARALDGLAMAGVFLVAALVVLLIHINAGTHMGRMLQPGEALNHATMLRIMGVATLLGFLLGAMNIADIRKIARSEF